MRKRLPRSRSSVQHPGAVGAAGDGVTQGAGESVEDGGAEQEVADVRGLAGKNLVELPGSEPLPQFVLYPLAEQVADKLCAMYGNYGRDRDQPSSRYRDLVDLAIIVTNQELDAARTAEALRDEAKRRDLELPAQLTAPSADWEAGYRQVAAGTLLPLELHTLSAALSAVAGCLEPVLAGSHTEGTWSPHRMSWS
jgi:hypothetical protein